jgi:hypothetical protein
VDIVRAEQADKRAAALNANRSSYDLVSLAGVPKDETLLRNKGSEFINCMSIRFLEHAREVLSRGSQAIELLPDLSYIGAIACFGVRASIIFRYVSE